MGDRCRFLNSSVNQPVNLHLVPALASWVCNCSWPWYTTRNKAKPLSLGLTDQARSHKTQGKWGRDRWTEEAKEMSEDVRGGRGSGDGVLEEPVSADVPDRLH